ncbi:MAG TPA: Hsp20/alpha crystallin family protein, partial [Chloroflexota bacterium]|nr:Hsp20/alpha crystallin family protein [Chloroflexota bacterium]
ESEMASQNLARYNNTRGMMPLSEAMNQLLRDAFTTPFTLGSTALTAGMGVNLYERDDSLILQIPLPGVKPDQLNISVRENVVTLQGTTEIPAPDGARPIFQGAGGGQFREQIVLPSDVDAEQASAQYQDGVLMLTLPKAQHARERTVAVSQGQARTGGDGQSQARINADSQRQSSSASQAQSGTAGEEEKSPSQSSVDGQRQASTAQR